MLQRIAFFILLIGLYILGWWLSTMQDKPEWIVPALMAAVFLALVAAMYLRVLPALLALPVLAFSLAAIAGMNWKDIFTIVFQDGSIRLGKWIIAAIMGAILAQVVEKTGIAQTAIKKTAELGGDRPIILAVLLTIVIALLFTTLGGLGAVIMVATIVIPILLSLGLRPLYVGCLFLLAMSLGGAFNLVNWQFYQSELGMTQGSILNFALPFAVLMLVTTFVFLGIEGKRMGKARYKAMVTEQETAHAFVPWYALLTPLVPLVPVLFFALLPKVYTAKPTVTAKIDSGIVSEVGMAPTIFLEPQNAKNQQPIMVRNGKSINLKSEGKYTVTFAPERTTPAPPLKPAEIDVTNWSKTEIVVAEDPANKGTLVITPTTTPATFDFPIVVALLLGIIYGAITTWKRGTSTVQLITKSAFDGVGAVGPALVLMVGIGMVLNATMAPAVSDVISPILGKAVPHGKDVGAMLHYVALFAILAPLALYRGPLNLYGMGAGLIGALKPLMPAGAIMGAFMSVGMIQGVSDPTNTHNVWIANYTSTDVQDILKRTLPYMWILAIIGLILSAVLYYAH